MFGLQAESVFIPDWAGFFLETQLFPAQIVFTIIIVVTFGLIATERLHKTVAALGGGVATLIAGGYFEAAYSWVPSFKWFVSGGFVTSGLLFSFDDVYKEFISWSTILIIISIVIITTVAGRSGLFEYLIVKVIKFSGGDIRRLFLYIWILSFILTMVLGNNPTFIIVSVLVLLLTRILDLNPIPYILGTVFVVNAASSSTVIGSFVNILISGYYNLDPTRWLSYPTFLILGLPFAIVCTAIALFFIFRYYKDAFEIPKEKEEYLETRARLLSFDERTLVRDPKIFRRLSILLIATIAGFVVAGFVGIPFYVIALIFAFAFLFVSGEDPEKTLREVDWSLIFFFIGIFIIVGGVDRTKILEILGSSLGNLTVANVPGATSLVSVFCGVLSGILDNISVTTALLFVTPSLAASALISENLIIWSLIYGANIGASLTPIGGIPNLIAITGLEKEGFHISWAQFLKIGVPITLVSLAAGIPLLIGFSTLLGGVDYTSIWWALLSIV
ncbi:MAG: SLC13 family permease [Candidatus Lokiarchaeia archaeon]